MNTEDLIDKVVHNIALSEEEQHLWDKIKNQPEVVEQLDFINNLETPLRIENRKQLKDQFIKIESTIDNTKIVKLEPEQNLKNSNPSNETKKVFNIKYLFAAAAILLIGAVTFLMLPKPTPENYFANYYEPYPSIVNPILKGESDSENLQDRAFTAYQNKNYESALSLFSSIQEPSDTIQFYKAISHLELNQLTESKVILEDMKLRENRFQNEAAWYEALSLLKEGNTLKAGLILSNIAYTKDHPYAAEAEVLFNKIK